MATREQTFSLEKQNAATLVLDCVAVQPYPEEVGVGQLELLPFNTALPFVTSTRR